MNYSIDFLFKACGGELIISNGPEFFSHILIDSRKVVFAEESVFIAIKGDNHDAHEFLESVYSSGVRTFIVEKDVLAGHKDINLIRVDDALQAFQNLVAAHRDEFEIPVIGITGSNGKTIVKEWLYRVLSNDEVVYRSPKSYNSQVGVPLSIWGMRPFHTMSIIEAGISRPAEMVRLEKVIKPTIGIFTHLGAAHDEGFNSRDEKLNEKLMLFKECGQLIYPADEELVRAGVAILNLPSTLGWSLNGNGDLNLVLSKENMASFLEFDHQGSTYRVRLPFDDGASIHNVCTLIATLVALEKPLPKSLSIIQDLKPVELRLQLKPGRSSSTIIEDVYSSDLGSLRIALDLLENNDAENKIAILSDIVEAGLDDDELCTSMRDEIAQHRIDELYLVGPATSSNGELFNDIAKKVKTFRGTDDLISSIPQMGIANSTILIKGARKFELERASELMEEKHHQAILEVNLNAIENNLNVFRKRLDPGTSIMVMVKAFSYGSGDYEIARLLEYHQVDYLTVAYVDEGIALRKAGITMPIMVMNTGGVDWDLYRRFDLQPEVYSMQLLQSLVAHCKQVDSPFAIHLKFDTGMNRLGFRAAELDEVFDLLKSISKVRVVSAFSHLATADDDAQSAFTLDQIDQFRSIGERIKSALGKEVKLHILNSAGILNFPEAMMDMVRLGIGLYGVNTSSKSNLGLQQVATLKARISQIRQLKAGETIGYGRAGKIESDSRIATINVGYADGIRRSASMGRASVNIGGKLCPIVGNVCMDMLFADISGLEAVNENDEVIVFGEHPTIEQWAEWLDTIPYEIMTSVSQRIKRIYIQE